MPALPPSESNVRLTWRLLVETEPMIADETDVTPGAGTHAEDGGDVGRGVGRGVAVGRGVGLGVAVGRGVGVAVGASVGVGLGVAVAVAVAVGVTVACGVGVGLSAVGVAPQPERIRSVVARKRKRPLRRCFDRCP